MMSGYCNEGDIMAKVVSNYPSSNVKGSATRKPKIDTTSATLSIKNTSRKHKSAVTPGKPGMVPGKLC